MPQLEEASEGWEPKVGGKDGWVWKNNAAKTFIVKEVYASLITYRFGDVCSFFNQIWNLLVPSKVKGLLWRVGHKIQTKDNLRRMIILQDGTSLNCVFCNLGMEFAKYLLFECCFCHQIWQRCYVWLGKIRVLHVECKEHFSQHFRILPGAKARCVEGTVSVEVIWSLWKHMNHIIFNEASLDARELLDSIKYQAWSWCKAYVKDFKLSLHICCIY